MKFTIKTICKFLWKWTKKSRAKRLRRACDLSYCLLSYCSSLPVL